MKTIQALALGSAACMAALRRSRWVGAIFLSAALAACGGSNEAQPDSPSVVSGALTGTAATGAAIAGGTVEVKCAAGPDPAAVTTGASGSWTASLSGVRLPCKVKVSGGNLPSGTAFHSIAVGLGTVNITPMTDLVVASLTGQNPAAWYSSVTAGALGNITGAAVTAAVDKIRAGINVPAFGASVSPLTTPLTIGDALDKVLDALKAAVPDHAALLALAQGQNFASTFAQTYAAALNNALAGSGTGAGGGGTGGGGTGGGGTGGGGAGGGGTGGGTANPLLAAASCSPGITSGFSLVAEVTVAGVVSVPVCVDGLTAKPATESEFCSSSEFRQGLPPGFVLNSCNYNPGTGVANVTASFSPAPVVPAISYSVRYTFIPRF